MIVRICLYVCLFYKHLHRRILFLIRYLFLAEQTKWVHLGLIHVISFQLEKKRKEKQHTLISILYSSHSVSYTHSLAVSLIHSFIHSLSCVLCVVFDTKWAFAYDNESWHLIRRSTLFFVFSTSSFSISISISFFILSIQRPSLQSAELFYWGLDHNIIIAFFLFRSLHFAWIIIQQQQQLY